LPYRCHELNRLGYASAGTVRLRIQTKKIVLHTCKFGPMLTMDLKGNVADKGFTVTSSRSLVSIALYGSPLLAMLFFSRAYHFRILEEIDHYHDVLPNKSIPLPNFHGIMHDTQFHSDGLIDLKQTEKHLMEWQEAFYTYKLEMMVGKIPRFNLRVASFAKNQCL
jgi:hypothetical protein